jgi:hypothetical protein
MKRLVSGTRFEFLTTLESVFGALAGVFADQRPTTEDLLLRRAANDAEQR